MELEINKVYEGDCIEVMKQFKDNTFDAIVTDPPYCLSTSKRFGNSNWENEQYKSEELKKGGSVFTRNIKGFMGKEWDNDVAFKIEIWKECFRVLKHGGHLLAFGGTRTYHRLVCAIEDSGFEIRDMISWIYGSGFPKSLNIGKQIDKMGAKDISWFGKWLREWREKENITQKEIAKLFLSKTGGLTGCVANWELGLNIPTPEQFSRICEKFNLPFESIEEAEREVIGKKKTNLTVMQKIGDTNISGEVDITVPATPEAKQWEGWGTAMKPSHEDIVVAQKPLNTIPSLLYDIKCQLNLLVKNVEKSLKLNQADPKEEMLSSVQRDAQKKNDSKEVMDICQSKTEQESGYLNTMLLWQNYLEEISKEMNKSTTLMENEMTTDLKILNSLLGQVIQENIIHQQKSQANGLTANASLVENNLKSVLIKSRLLNITSVQENVISGGNNLNLSPNCEPIVVARKPLSEKNVALNVLKWGTGGINIDESRIGTEDECRRIVGGFIANSKIYRNDEKYKINTMKTNISKGRFPANIILDETIKLPEGNQRFFYVAKSSKGERNYGCEEMRESQVNDGRNKLPDNAFQRGVTFRKNVHPTVKPVSLMEYLIKLVTKEGALVLDPFIGSGTTAIACYKTHRDFIGIEKEKEYIKIANARIKIFTDQKKLGDFLK